MGAQQTTKTGDESGVSFMVGALKAHVLILRPEDLVARNAIINAMLNLSKLQETYNLVYLATPRMLGAMIDTAVFRSRGIGLLFFDERRIEEALTPQPSQPTPQVSTQRPQEPAVVTELATLKTMYVEMERSLTQLRDDLAQLRNAKPFPDQMPHIASPDKRVDPQRMFVQNPMQSGDGLPSYFTNNPWLEVLSKRGHEPIAG
jgi:hypothetical protein